LKALEKLTTKTRKKRSAAQALAPREHEILSFIFFVFSIFRAFVIKKLHQAQFVSVKLSNIA
jgi:hypothetical protein